MLYLATCDTHDMREKIPFSKTGNDPAGILNSRRTVNGLFPGSVTASFPIRMVHSSNSPFGVGWRRSALAKK
jgi:hypothetical protein